MYNRFKINGNKNVVEPVTSDVIEKLAEESKSIDSQDNIQEDSVEGTLTVYRAYKDSCTYLVQKYNPNLRINIEDDYYIRFKDQSISQALISLGYGDNYGVTMTDASRFTNTTLFRENSLLHNCISFDELEYFTNIHSLPWGAFANNTNLTSINLKNITEVNFNAFYGCTSLSNLGDISNIDFISREVFDNCNLQGEIDLSHVTNMDVCSFNHNPNLTRVILSSSTTVLNGFAGCTSLTYIGPLDNITSVTGFRGFENTPNLTMIFNGPNVNNYNNAPFYGSSFSEIILPNLIFISGRNDVFCNSKATHIEISNDNTQIPDSTFNGCTNLKRINSDDDYTCGLSNITSIGNYAFLNCKLLANINLSYCTSIGNNSFEGCTNLQTVQLSNQITDLKIDTFAQCTNLISVTGLQNVETISSAFYACSNLVSVDFTSNLKIIKDYAFNNCSKLVSIGNNIKPITIGKQSFRSCSMLTSIDLSECTSIGEYCFENCSSLTSINKFSNNITKLEYGLFGNCINLTSPNGIIEIPASVTEMDSNIFADSTSITTLKFLGTTPPILLRTYYHRTKSQILVPQSALNAYRSAETWQNTDLQNKIVGY